MSFKHKLVVNNPYFSPLGDIPAVCLTQNLPPDCDATLLLLGCGDICNILFTAYAGAGFEGRTFDYTCCDDNVEVLARNIVALTLIADGVDSTKEHLWDIYYNPFLFYESHLYLSKHVQKLLHYSESIPVWTRGPYGRLVRFCDSTTLQNVARVWSLFAVDSTQSAKHKNLENLWKEAKWAKRSGNKDSERILNPMFAPLDSNRVIRPESGPLSGFHLATVSTHLSATSPLRTPTQNQTTEASKIFDAADNQLQEWCKSFCNAMSKYTIRFIHADAIAFCHVLRYHDSHGESTTANWYRGPWDFHELVLDSLDYRSPPTAPMEFNVIDTSDLVERVGGLNLLAAVGPLLAPEISSTLRTEISTPQQGTLSDHIEALLCGDLATNATLVGLQPMQYWTNSIATWNLPEDLSNKFPDTAERPSRYVMLWKATDVRNMQFEPDVLAKLIFNLYLRMFQNESHYRSVLTGGQSANIRKTDGPHYQQYTRASFCILLHCIREKNIVDWDPFFEQLITLIWKEKMGKPYVYSLHVNLCMFGLRPRPTGAWYESPTSFDKEVGIFPPPIWLHLPPVICVTFVVPRKAVQMFKDITKGNNGTPVVHVMLHPPSAKRQIFYSDVQLGYGTVTASGAPWSVRTNDHKVSIKPQDTEEPGDDPLIVSFLAYTGSIVKNGAENCGIVFAVKDTRENVAKFHGKLGYDLGLHRSTFGSADVFITRHMPNLRGDLVMADIKDKHTESDKDVQVIIQPYLDITSTKIVILHMRYKIFDKVYQDLFRDRANIVSAEAVGPWMLLKLGDNIIHHRKLSFPLDNKRGKLSMDRDLMQIQFAAPILEPQVLQARSDLMFTAEVGTSNEVSLQDLHYVEPHALPTIFLGSRHDDYDRVILTTCPSSTMTAHEYSRYNKYVEFNPHGKPGHFDVKGNLFDMFKKVVGMPRTYQATNFVLRNGADDTIAYISVSKLRMDISNQTVFLDAGAVLAEFANEERIRDALLQGPKGNTAFVHIEDAEVAYWKQLLPLFAERCRAWEHEPNCEFRNKGDVPISELIRQGYSCACGLGVFPAGYLKKEPVFRRLIPWAVRVAIPVIYFSPICNAEAEVATGAFLRSKMRMQSLWYDHPIAKAMDIAAKRGTCFVCSERQAKNSKAFLECSQCKYAQYCSAKCQREDWKVHNTLCKLLKGMGTF